METPPAYGSYAEPEHHVALTLPRSLADAVIKAPAVARNERTFAQQAIAWMQMGELYERTILNKADHPRRKKTK